MVSEGGILPNSTILRGRRDRGESPQEERPREDQGEDRHLHSEQRLQEGPSPPHWTSTPASRALRRVLPQLTSTPASRALQGVLPHLTSTSSIPRPPRCAPTPDLKPQHPAPSRCAPTPDLDPQPPTYSKVYAHP